LLLTWNCSDAEIFEIERFFCNITMQQAVALLFIWGNAGPYQMRGCLRLPHHQSIPQTACQNAKNVTFSVLLSCCTRFLEHCYQFLSRIFNDGLARGAAYKLD